LLEAAEQGWYDLVVSEHLLEEVRDVLGRPKMQAYFPASAIAEHTARVRAAAFMVLGHYAGEVPSHTADPDDDYLVELALATDAEVLVSGDRHLRDLGTIASGGGTGVCRVLTTSAFLKELDVLDEVE
jgi:putative PIN family toxin of toxin-antitoxin system